MLNFCTKTAPILWRVLLVGCILTIVIVPLVLILNEDVEKDSGVITETESVWRWECVQGYCQKLRITSETKDSALSLPTCRIFCSPSAAIWPLPTGKFKMGSSLARLNIDDIQISGIKDDAKIAELVRGASKRFTDIVDKIQPQSNSAAEGNSLLVTLDVANTNIDKLTWHTNEGYELNMLEPSDNRIEAVITANNFFGARHGLETLSQLIIYDDIKNELQIVTEVSISDEPKYTHRGISLDTARNYITVDTIKRTIDGLASSKLNTFHWHITDTHSFPYVSKSQPILSQLGAYSPRKVYTRQDVADIVEYGRIRGVRIMPEFDAPAHVGEGWQDTNFVTCFNKQPWQEYCAEPPCGQLDPTKPGMYDVLEDIYKDMVEQFDPDIFHMGGDEVNFNCWNTTENIVEWMAENGMGTSEEDFVKLWDIFQSEALKRYTKYADTPVILWTSTLTQMEYVESYLPKDRYVMQVWSTRRDKQIADLLERDYRLILSNYDTLYLDCGFAGWIEDGNNWCSPYKGWQKIYDYSPASVAGDRLSQILGGEAALWTEQVDDSSVDSRLWPRAAAMAERLWADPSTDWMVAEQRMLVHTERLITRGINADALEPEWCMQNEANCPIGGAFNVP